MNFKPTKSDILTAAIGEAKRPLLDEIETLDKERQKLDAEDQKLKEDYRLKCNEAAMTQIVNGLIEDLNDVFKKHGVDGKIGTNITNNELHSNSDLKVGLYIIGPCLTATRPSSASEHARHKKIIARQNEISKQRQALSHQLNKITAATLSASMTGSLLDGEARNLLERVGEIIREKVKNETTNTNN